MLRYCPDCEQFFYEEDGIEGIGCDSPEEAIQSWSIIYQLKHIKPVFEDGHLTFTIDLGEN